MLNIMLLERRTWIEEGADLRKEANSAHVAGLNVTEKTVIGTLSQSIGKVIRV